MRSRCVSAGAATAAIKEPRPSDEATQPERNKYAIRFADRMAVVMARDLGPKLKGIIASSERGAASVHLRDSGGTRRYTHNMKRNEEELRIEATGYHKRQPYAVMIGVMLLTSSRGASVAPRERG